MWGPRSRDGGIDQIPLPVSPGRLWLCGKHVVGPDPEAALKLVGATAVVCLNERHELEHRYPHYVEWLYVQPSCRAVWYPIPDLHAPALDDVAPFLDELQGRLEEGERLIVHCGAGIGRAGTVATALLIGMGATLEDALATVADHRPMGGPEVGAQLSLVRELARRQRKAT